MAFYGFIIFHRASARIYAILREKLFRFVSTSHCQSSQLGRIIVYAQMKTGLPPELRAHHLGNVTLASRLLAG